MDYEQKTKLQRGFIIVAQGNLVQALHCATGGHKGLCRDMSVNMAKGEWSDEEVVNSVFEQMTETGLEMVRVYVNEKLEGLKV